jgi:hypothetical protein
MISGAVLCPERIYRYSLWRVWDDKLPVVSFVMLNPSTADENENDPTIRRCIAFATAWGYGGLVAVNMYAFRATKPKELWIAADPIGPDNDDHICAAIQTTTLVVCAWGAHGSVGQRSTAVYDLIRSCDTVPHYLKLTSKGEPTHPLYLPGDLKPIEWHKEMTTKHAA